MNITSDTTIGQIVANDYRTAQVFEQYHIDFCCNGSQTIAEVTEAMQIDAEALLRALEQAIVSQVASDVDYQSWPLDILADYIVQTHHTYVEKNIGVIKPYLEKICHVHGVNHPELHTIKQIFERSAGELAGHQKKEEIIVFPFIKRLVHASQNNERLTLARSVEAPIDMLSDEHDAQGEAFKKIASLCNDYEPPVDACNTYRVSLELLREFQLDLHKHIHLENNILFPKAVELEKSVATIE